jgi:hypothetical protein
VNWALSPFEFPRLANVNALELCGAKGVPVESPSLVELRDGDIPGPFATLQRRELGRQEAPARARWAQYEPGLPVVVSGCALSGREVRFLTPSVPTIRLHCDSTMVEVEAVAQSMTVDVEQGVLSVQWGFEHRLHRAFIPGLHKRIPIAVHIDGREPMPFPQTVPLRERAVTA